MIFSLAPDHVADLTRSGLTHETIERLQIRAVPPHKLRQFTAVTSAYSLPYFSLDGQKQEFSRWRLFAMPSDRDTRVPKYHQAKGSDPGLYFPPLVPWQEISQNAAQPLVITEGEKKAAKGCQEGLRCIGVGGVWNWRVKIDSGDRMELPIIDTIVWAGRAVEIVPDSDAWRPEKIMNILAGFYALARILVQRGALVKLVKLPDVGGAKVGLDDWLTMPGVQCKEDWPRLERFDMHHKDLKELTAWYRRWEKRQSQDDKGTIKDLADVILKDNHFAQDAGRQLYWYENGRYQPDGNQRVAELVKKILVGNRIAKKWSSHRSNEVAEFIRVDACRLWEVPPLSVVNLQNGLLDLSSKVLKPHTPAHLSPIQLPVLYQPGATAPGWEEFIFQVFPEDAQCVAFELIAWLMRPDTSIQKAVLLTGEGANGKSTFLNAVMRFLGTTNVSNVALHSLEKDKFAVARLVGKLANICPDLPSTHLDSTSAFKGLTGGDRMLAERKFKDSFEFTPYCRLVFSANHFPHSKDNSEAFARRLLIIPFNRTIAPHNQIPRSVLDNQLADPQELAGVLNKALECLPALLQRNGFTETQSAALALHEFREHTDPFRAWLATETERGSEHWATKKDLYISYTGYAKRIEAVPSTQTAFGRALKSLCLELKESQRTVNGNIVWIYSGIGLKKC